MLDVKILSLVVSVYMYVHILGPPTSYHTLLALFLSPHQVYPRVRLGLMVGP